MIADRIAGAILISIGLLGFLTVADDVRHVGEVVGVGAIVLAGVILVASTAPPVSISRILARSSAIGVFPGLILGAALDDMIVGVAAGLTAGVVMGIIIQRRQRSTESHAP